MKTRAVAIVQARMGSARFPGKMLAQLGPYSLVEWVLRRVSQARQLDQVILATTDGFGDDPLVHVAEQCGIDVFRGDEVDVLQRFVGAAQSTKADQIIRVCGDNPFVDPGEIDRLVVFFAQNPCDYACNHLDRLGSGYADGFGAEILSVSLLRNIAATATESRHREHATLYLWDHASEFELKVVPAPGILAHPYLRFDVDVPSDLDRLKRLIVAGVDIDSSAASIVEMALKESI